MPLIFISPFFVHRPLFPCHFHFSNDINGQSRLILRPLSAIFPILDFVMIYAVGFDCGGSFLHMTWKGTTNQKYDKYCVLLREIPLQTACRSRFAALRGAAAANYVSNLTQILFFIHVPLRGDALRAHMQLHARPRGPYGSAVDSFSRLMRAVLHTARHCVPLPLRGAARRYHCLLRVKLNAVFIFLS